MKSLSGKVAAVIGSNCGVGKRTALGLGEAGATVCAQGDRSKTKRMRADKA